MKEMKSGARYPDYNVLDKWSSPDWDDQTRDIVRKRLQEVPSTHFFDKHELLTLAAVIDRVLPQPDRTDEEKVPILPWIDEKPRDDKRVGYRYEELPPQREPWRIGLAGIDETARVLFHGKAFMELEPMSQDVVLTHIARGDAPGEIWERMPAARFFKNVLLVTIVKIYYAHPLAWNEIGYNGPSSPRGHVRKGEAAVDPWEARDEESRAR